LSTRVSFGKQFWNPDLGESGPPELMQDKSIKDKIQAEHSGILSWIVRGCISWHHDVQHRNLT